MLECQFLTCSLGTVEGTIVCVQLLLGMDSEEYGFLSRQLINNGGKETSALYLVNISYHRWESTRE